METTLTDTAAVITVGRDDIFSPFDAAARTAAKNHHIEVFKWVRFKSEEGSDDGFLEATNGFSSVRIRITGHDATAPVDVYLPKRLASVLKAMPSGPIQLELGKELTVHGSALGDTSFTLGIMPDDPKDQPLDVGQDVDWENSRTVELELQQALEKASRYCTNDQARQNLMSVIVSNSENGTVIASSDSYRMYVHQSDVQGFEDEGSFTLPRSAIGEMARFGGNVRVAWNDNRVYLTDGEDLNISTLRIHGDVPDFSGMVQRIVDSNDSIKIKIPRIDLLNAINQVAVMASATAQTVVLEFLPEGIEIDFKGDDGKANSRVMSPVEIDNPLKVAFNIGFFRDGLMLMEDAEVDFRLINAVRPAVMISEDGLTRYMIAPVRIT